MLSDLRSAVRVLSRRWRTSLAIAFTLTLGLTVSGALFATLDALFLKSLPLRSPERLFIVGPASQFISGQPGTLALDEIDELNRQAGVEGAAGYSQPAGLFSSGDAETGTLRDTAISARFFDVLGVSPQIGRLLLPSDATRAEPRSVLISNTLWRTRLGAEPSVLGRTVTLNGRTVIVVGIMRPNFDFPNGTEVWVCAVTSASFRMRSLYAIVRSGISASPQITLPSFSGPLIARKLGEFLRPRGSASVTALFIGTALTVLLAWVHLGALQLTQAVDRARETAVRAALGAGWNRLIRQWSTEIVLMTGLALAAAIGILPAALSFLIRLLPPDLTVGQPVAADLRVFVYLAVLTLLGSFALILGPLAVIRHTRLTDLLHGRLPVLGGVGLSRIRWGLLTCQVGLVTLLLYLAGLSVRSVVELDRVGLGFAPDNLVAIELPMSKSMDAEREQFRAVRERLQHLPFVLSVAAGWLPPAYGGTAHLVLPDLPLRLQELTNLTTRNALELPAYPGYLSTIGAALIEGSEGEPDSRRDDVLLSESLVRALGLRAPVTGRTVYVDGPIPHRVAGVVADIRGHGPDQPPGLYVYLPRYATRSVVMRTVIPAKQMTATLTDAVRAATGDSARVQVEFASDSYERVTAEPRSRSVLMALLATSCMFLGIIGIFGTVGEAVRRKTRDAAIRIALGGRPRYIVWALVGQTMNAVIVGAIIGLAAGVAAGHFASSLLFGIAPADSLTMVAAVSLLLAGAALGAFGPARRACRIDPIIALRDE